jgi:UrcA family protein
MHTIKVVKARRGNMRADISKHRVGFRAGLVAGLLGIAIAGAAALPAAAATQIGPDVSVHYSDLDITGTVGAEQLYERIQRAAQQVCQPSDAQVLLEVTAARRCRNEVIARTVAQVKSPQLAAVYAARTHRAHV